MTKRPGPDSGQDHHSAKLTDHEVEQIRQQYEDGEGGYLTLARRFDVHKMTIRDIVKGRRR